MQPDILMSQVNVGFEQINVFLLEMCCCLYSIGLLDRITSHLNCFGGMILCALSAGTQLKTEEKKIVWYCY